MNAPQVPPVNARVVDAEFDDDGSLIIRAISGANEPTPGWALRLRMHAPLVRGLGLAPSAAAADLRLGDAVSRSGLAKGGRGVVDEAVRIISGARADIDALAAMSAQLERLVKFVESADLPPLPFEASPADIAIQTIARMQADLDSLRCALKAHYLGYATDHREVCNSVIEVMEAHRDANAAIKPLVEANIRLSDYLAVQHRTDYPDVTVPPGDAAIEILRRRDLSALDTDADMLWKAMGGQGKPPIAERTAMARTARQEVDEMRQEFVVANRFRKYVQTGAELPDRGGGPGWDDVRKEHDILAAFARDYGYMAGLPHSRRRHPKGYGRPIAAAMRAAAFRVTGVRNAYVLDDGVKILIAVTMYDGVDAADVVAAVKTKCSSEMPAGLALEVISFDGAWTAVTEPKVTIHVGSGVPTIHEHARCSIEEKIRAVAGVHPHRSPSVVHGLGRVLAFIDVADDAERDTVRYDVFHAICDEYPAAKLRVHTFDEVWDMTQSAPVTESTPEVDVPPPRRSPEWDRILSAVQRMYPDAAIDDSGVVRLLVEGKAATENLRDVQALLAAARTKMLTSLGKDPDAPEYAKVHFFNLLDPACDSAKAWCLVRDALEVANPVELVQTYARACTDLSAANAQTAKVLDEISMVYTERARVVAALAGLALFLGERVGVREHDPNDTEWDPAHRIIVFIELPDGKGGVFQASWHLHDSERHLVAHLPPYEPEWDGHTTAQKYERMAAAADPRTWEIVRAHVVRRKEGGPPTVPEARRDAWHLLLDATVLDTRQTSEP